MAVPARHRRPGRHAALACASARHGGLDAGEGAERVEPRGRLAGLDDRRRRLVPQGLRSCRRRASALEWAVRFESVNYRSRVWLNGKPVGDNTGAYIPFEFRLNGHQAARHEPARHPRRLPRARRPTSRPRGLNADGVADRRLVELLAASSARSTSSGSTRWTGRPCRCVPRSRAACTSRAGQGRPSRNVNGRAERVARHRHASARRRLNLGTRRPRRQRGRGRSTTTIRMPQPRRCGRRRGPYLYHVKLTARRRRAHGQQLPAAHRHPLDPVSATAAWCSTASALQPARRRRARGRPRRRASRSTTRSASGCVDEVKAVGATLMRTHYPLHPYTHELADREGVLIWSEIPVYALKTPNLAKRRRDARWRPRSSRRTSTPTRTTRRCCCGRSRNELSSQPGPGADRLHQERRPPGARRSTRRRPVGLAVAGYPTVALPDRPTRRST